MFRSVLAILVLIVSLASHARAQDAGSRRLELPETIGAQLQETDPIWDGSVYDEYVFRGSAGQAVRVTLASYEFDATLVFGYYSAQNGFQAAGLSDAQGAASTTLEESLTEDRDYVLRVTSSNGRLGSYALMLYADEASWIPGSIQMGDSISGVLTGADFVDPGSVVHQDLYEIELTADQRILITMNSTDFEPVLTLLQNTGAGILERDRSERPAGTVALPPVINTTIYESGTYWIGVSSDQEDALGEYWVKIQRIDEPTTTATGTPAYEAIEFPESILGELDDIEGIFHEDFAFTVTSAQRIVAEMRSTAFDALLHVGRMVDGELQILSSSDNDGGGTNARLEVALPGPGTYVFRATSPDSVVFGQYVLYMGPEGTDLSYPPTPIGIGGRSTEGELTRTDQVTSMGFSAIYFDEYVIDGTAGQRLRVAMTSPEFEALLQLWRLDGDARELVWEGTGPGGAGGTAQMTATLPETGRYVISALSAEAFPVRFGRYELLAW